MSCIGSRSNIKHEKKSIGGEARKHGKLEEREEDKCNAWGGGVCEIMRADGEA